MNLNYLDIENKMLPKLSQKPFSLNKFFSKHVSAWFQKKYLLCTISWHSRSAFFNHFEKNVYIFLHTSLRKFLFRRCCEILSAGEGVRGAGGRGWRKLNNSLKATRCLGLIKCFKIFHFNWNFWKFNYFLAFQCFHPKHKTLKFSRQFGLQWLDCS